MRRIRQIGIARILFRQNCEINAFFTRVSYRADVRRISVRSDLWTIQDATAQIERQRFGVLDRAFPHDVREDGLMRGAQGDVEPRIAVLGRIARANALLFLRDIQLQKKSLERQESKGSSKETEEPASLPSADKLQSNSGHRLGAVLITKAQKVQLRDNGYTDEQIGKMKPEEAHKILGI